MYEIDEHDTVVVLDGIPRPTTGVPEPCVLADERGVVLSYFVWHTEATIVTSPTAIVRFSAIAHMFGMPNDEALGGHPLFDRGLGPYGAFRVENSSWIRKLERMNSVHRGHRPETYSHYQHVIFTFHDSMFECVCVDFEVKITNGPVGETLAEMIKRL
jgi:hypothetical protein